MEISRGAAEIINTARFNPLDQKAIVRLVRKHGITVTAEAIAVLAQVIDQDSGVPSISKQ